MEETQRRRRSCIIRRPGAAIAALLLAAIPVVAQQQTPPAPTPSDQSQSSDESKSSGQSKTGEKKTPDQKTESDQKSGTSNDRLFYTLPNFLTVENEGQAPRLNAKEKFKLEARSQFDWVEIPWYALLAGFSQAENSEAGYGQGAEGYGKRYGSEWGDGAIENFMVGAVVSSALRQDPRYYEMGKGGFFHRARYAISRIFITRSDSGNPEFNCSEICGSGMAAAISNYTYHPRDERNLSNTASIWGTQIGLDTFTLVVKEFWPDIHRSFSKKRHDTSTP